MGTTFEKLTPRIIQFRDYKQFYNNKFRQKLLPELSLQNLRTNCSGLEKASTDLDRFPPRKKKCR